MNSVCVRQESILLLLLVIFAEKDLSMKELSMLLQETGCNCYLVWLNKVSIMYSPSVSQLKISWVVVYFSTT